MTTIEAIQSDYQALVAKLDREKQEMQEEMNTMQLEMKLEKEKDKKPKVDVDEISNEGKETKKERRNLDGQFFEAHREVRWEARPVGRLELHVQNGDQRDGAEYEGGDGLGRVEGAVGEE